jgi:hypothetical protein
LKRGEKISGKSPDFERDARPTLYFLALEDFSASSSSFLIYFSFKIHTLVLQDFGKFFRSSLYTNGA